MELNPAFEYRTTFTQVPDNFPNHADIASDLSRISPKPPKGEDWQLASSSSVQTDKGPVIFYFWERPARPRDRQYPPN